MGVDVVTPPHFNFVVSLSHLDHSVLFLVFDRFPSKEEEAGEEPGCGHQLPARSRPRGNIRHICSLFI